ncbi:MAG: macro domain-containing protein [bacterium]
MIEFRRGDILAAEADALVNTVNCVGVMGRGIALQFKERFPGNFQVYAAACRREEVRPGHMLVWETRELTQPRFVINFPTKRHWRGKSRLEDVRAGLSALVSEVRRLGLNSIAIPPLGCGLGGLDWGEVRPLIEESLAELPAVRAYVYEPGGGREDGRANASTEVPKMTPGRAALVVLMHRYLAGLMDPFVSLLEVHKLMYFLQVAGERLRLTYKKGPYGPYAENLRHVLRAVEGHLIVGYGDGGDQPHKPLELVPGARADAEAFLRGHPGTELCLGKVTRLVEGFETSFGLELLATVHWVVAHEGADTPEGAVEATHRWSARKKQFAAEQVALAFHRLHDLGWSEHATVA